MLSTLNIHTPCPNYTVAYFTQGTCLMCNNYEQSQNYIYIYILYFFTAIIFINIFYGAGLELGESETCILLWCDIKFCPTPIPIIGTGIRFYMVQAPPLKLDDEDAER